MDGKVNNDPGLPEFLQEKIRNTIITEGFEATPEGLMDIFGIIVTEVIATNYPLNITAFMGIIFFIDRVVIHEVIFGHFIGINPSIIRAILDTPCFRRTHIPQTHFDVMTSHIGIKGGRFDWHLYCYPEVPNLGDIMRDMYTGKCESYFMVMERGAQWMTEKKFSLIKADKLSLAPETDNKRLKYCNKKMEEVMSMFSQDKPVGKSWLLYMEN